MTGYLRIFYHTDACISGGHSVIALLALLWSVIIYTILPTEWLQEILICIDERNYEFRRYLNAVGFRYIEVLSYTFYCNFGRAEDYRSLHRRIRYIEEFVTSKNSLHRRIRYIEVREIEVPLRFKLYQASETRAILVCGSSGSY